MHMTFTENSNTNFDASNPTAFDTCRELQGQQNTRRYFRDFGDSVSGFGDSVSGYYLRILSHFRILSHDSVLGFEYALDVIFDRSIIK
jgi:hypothetical protein